MTLIPFTTGSAVISLLLVLSKPSPWLFQPRRTPSLTWFCTSTISLLSGFHQTHSLGYGSLRTFPGISSCKKARRTIGFIHRAFHSAPVSTRRIHYLALARPSWNMGAPPGTLSIKPLPTALNHVKDLPAWLSFSLGKHLLKIFPSRTFLHFPNVMTFPPSVICSKLSMICVHLQIHSSLIPVLISRTSTPVPWIPLFAIWPCPRDHFIHMPLHFGTTSRRKLSSASLCHPSWQLFNTILCNHCLIFFCLVLFSLPISLLLFSKFSDCPSLFLFGVFGHPFNLLFFNIRFCLASSQLL